MLELIWARPTAEFNGITGGYTGKGFKTVIAGARPRPKCRSAWCTSRTRTRSAPPSASFVEARMPADCSVEFHPHGGSPAIQLSYDSPFLAKAKDALSDEWPKPAVMIAIGGSIPVVGDFQTYLGMESLLVGFGLADDRIHSPNEKYELDLLPQGSALLGAHPRRAVRAERSLGDQNDTSASTKTICPTSRTTRSRGRHRHRDAGAQSASRPALRGADFARRRLGRRHPDRAGPEAGAEPRPACSATGASPRSSTSAASTSPCSTMPSASCRSRCSAPRSPRG